MKKFCFVILHYNEKSLVDTFECVESIEISCQKWQKQYQIIIVENGSGDSSAKILAKKYHNQKNVDVVISQENLGFAKGNNLGCDFAINQYTPDFLVVINNDTILKQKQFLDLIEKKYNEYQFDILGPYIFDRNLKAQNPVTNLVTTLEGIDQEIEYVKHQMNKKASYKERIVSVIKRNKRLFELARKTKEKLSNHKKNVDYESKSDVINVGLHGSALVFSEKYYKKYENVFYSKTFMFIEEDILYHRVQTENLISLYSPSLEIFHKEDKSTEAFIGNNREQNMWKLKNVQSSLEKFREKIILNDKEQKNAADI